MSFSPRTLWRRLVAWLVSPPMVRWWAGPQLTLRGPRVPARPFDLKNVQRLLVVRYDGMGDLVVMTGFLRELRRAAPQAKISLLIRSEWVPLMRANPHLDEVLAFKAEAYPSYQLFWRHRDALAYARQELWPRRFEAVLVPQTEFSFYDARILAYLSGAPVRIGWADPQSAAGSGGRSLLTQFIAIPAQFHEADKGYHFLEALGGQVRERQLELHWDSAADELAAGMAARLQPTGCRLVAVGLGASQANKLWPVERFVDVAKDLAGRMPVRFVGIGGGDLVAQGERLEAGLGDLAVSLAGKLALPQTAALLARCDLFVGCDSGPMHVAAAVGTPVVSLSGCPTDAPAEYSAHPGRIGPYCAKRRVVQPPVTGRGTDFFTDEIRTADVREAVHSLAVEAGLLPA
ncbi:MAG TPA: glycosyltransferase family 9 protein [Candidatus Limnocylindria bacterium]|jgi:heptosyltransferase-2|nr:glycosyltransferase family 9 protein [Candidatus Limnocylindria bacterium]